MWRTVVPRSASERAAASLAGRLGRTYRAVAIALTLLAVVLATLFGVVLLSLRPAQLEYAAASRAVEAAHADMVDQESGLRGYLLVRDDAFLQPYHRGVTQLRDDNAAVARLIGSDAALAPALLDVRLAQQAWTDRWASVVVGADTQLADGARDAFIDEGKALFDEYRAKEQILATLVDQRLATALERVNLAYSIGLGLVVITAGALAIGVARQRRTLASSVLAPVDDIVGATDLIGRGDLNARVEPSGPAELRRIGASVNAMAESLAQARVHAQTQQSVAEQQTERLRRILSMAREIAGSLSLKYVLNAVATSAVSISDFPRVLIWLGEADDSQTLTLAYDSATPKGLPRDTVHAEVGVGVVGQAVKHGRLATESESQESIVELHTDRPLRTLAVPLVVGAKVIGAMEFSSRDPIRLPSGSLDVLETLAIHAAASIEAARLHGEAEALSRTDPLTALANRRSLNGDLAAECARTVRYQRPMALIMLDVDHFKSYNDEFGHQRGDEALQEFASVMRRELRATDSAYRFGGEEFVVLARETDRDQAGVLAERLRQRIERHFAAHGTLRPITASFGVGMVPPVDPRPEAIVASADAALYRAKAAGRNRVVFSDGGVESTESSNGGGPRR